MGIQYLNYAQSMMMGKAYQPLPVLANATYALQINIGGPFTKSNLYSDQAATVSANVGERIRALKDITGTYTFSNSSQSGYLLNSRMFGRGSNRVIYCPGDASSVGLAGDFTLNVGTGGKYAIAAVIFSPRVLSSTSVHVGVCAGTSAGNGPTCHLYRGTPTYANVNIYDHGASNWAFGAGESTKLYDNKLTPHVVVWRFNDGEVEIWVDGALVDANASFAHATNLSSFLFLTAYPSGQYFQGGLGWFGVISGGLSNDEIVNLSNVLSGWFPGSGNTGTHTITSRFNLAQKGDGYTTDGTYHYVTADTTLYKFDSGGTLVDSISALQVAGQDHVGDCCYYNGRIYLVAETINGGSSTNKSISWFTADELAFEDSFEVTEVGEVSGLAISPETMELHVTDFYDDTNMAHYSFDDSGGTVAIEFVELHGIGGITNVQAITWRDPYWYFQTNQESIYRAHKDYEGENEFVFTPWDGNGTAHGNGIEYMALNVAEDDFRYVTNSNTANPILKIAMNPDGPSIFT